MTMQPTMPNHFTQKPLSGQGSANTLRLRVLMEQQQRLQIGQRIRDLRESSPQTNASIADYVGVGERAVANWISGATGITYRNAKSVAELFEVDVRWLWDGKERASNADLMDSLKEAEGNPSIQRLEDQLAALRTELLSELGGVRGELEDLRSQKAPGERSRGAKGS